jgi:hypothetical protein
VVAQVDGLARALEHQRARNELRRIGLGVVSLFRFKLSDGHVACRLHETAELSHADWMRVDPEPAGLDAADRPLFRVELVAAHQE